MDDGDVVLVVLSGGVLLVVPSGGGVVVVLSTRATAGIHRTRRPFAT